MGSGERLSKLPAVGISVALIVVFTAVWATVGASPALASESHPSLVDFSQCANGAVPSTSIACPGGFIKTSQLTSLNSHYTEDGVVPQRLVVGLGTGVPLAGHVLKFRYQARQGTLHAYDSLATWNLTQTTADRCQGLAATSCPAGTASTRPIPDDPAVLTSFTAPAIGVTATHMIAAGAGRQMTMYGGTITGVSVPSHSCAAPCLGDDWATITVTYSVATLPTKVMLLFGGHLAAGLGPRGWGPGLGAASTTARSYHLKWYGGDDDDEPDYLDNQISGTALRVAPAVNAKLPGPTPTVSLVGTNLKDGATLSGGNNPGGTLVFRLFAPTDATCGGTPTYTETVVVAGNGVYTTPTGFAANATGTWHWTVSYSGDAANLPASTACLDGPVTVKPLTPALATTPSTSGIVGIGLTDTATLAGGYNPTGTISFRLYPPSDASCATPSYTESVTVAGNASYTTGSFASTAAGIWRWAATYSGDGNNVAASSPCSSEPVIVAQAAPTLTTTPAPATAIVGDALADVATLAGGYNASGTITFRLYGPGDAACAGTPADYIQVISVAGNGTYGPTTPSSSNAAGTWRWGASYTGDPNNAAAASGCDEEPVTVGMRTPVLTAAADPASATYGASLGGRATLTGTFVGTGTLTLKLFRPADTSCASAAYTEAIAVSGDGPYHTSGTFTPTSAGTWHWKAAYSGDANNMPAAAGCDASAAAVVAAAPLTITANDSFKVYGEVLPPFTVRYSPFVLAEGPSVLGGSLAFATTATAGSIVGDYDVTPSGLTSTNYAIAFAKGTLRVYTGLARCWVPGTDGLVLTALPGARVELLSGASVVATSTADANAGYRFYPLGANATFTARYFGTLTIGDTTRNVSCGTAFRSDATGNAAAPDPPSVPSLQNHTWPAAFLLQSGVPIQDYLFREGQSSWFRVAVGAGQRIVVSLRDLPQDFSLIVYRDIGQTKAALGITGLVDLRLFMAQIAPAELSPAELSPAELSPAELSPAELSPAELSPAELSPAELSPAELSPAELSPAELSSDAYSAAQTQALYAISAHAGTSPELVVRNTWNNSGFFYVRVTGHNGAYDPARPFTLSARTESLSCAGAALTKTAPTTLNGGAATPKTIILTNTARLRHGDGTHLDAAAASALLSSLGPLAARPEVGGVVIDLAGDSGLAADYAQWDGNRSCPEAANVVAEATHDLIDRFRGPALEYVVLVGGNDAIPYRLSRDVAGLGSEIAYRPPVLDASASEASLRLGYVQSQDYYGATRTITRFGQELYIADAAVGRLVETSEDITAALGAYLATPGGASHPTNGLVTGYDFLADVAHDVATQLRTAGVSIDDALIEETGLGPLHATAWTADQLRAKLFATPFDLLSLNGHFAANRLLAADYTTRIGSEEIDALALSLVRNALILSTGCHSGYNIFDPDGVPIATQLRDFPQVLVSRGNTLVGSTGYAYGDSQFTQYTEALVSGIVRELRYGTGAVSIGKAIANAKRTYLGSLANVGGIDAKALAELTLYGLPMRSFDLGTTGRLTRPSPPTPGSTTAVPSASGGLASLDLVPTYALNRHDLVLPVVSGGTDTVSWYDADGRVATVPGQPVLPTTSFSLDLPTQVARGAVIVSGTYQDVPGFRPLVDVANTEVRGQHPHYASTGFAPLRTFGLNSLAGQTLVVTPFQYASDLDLTGGGAAVRGTARVYPSGGSTVRVYYSTDTGPTATADAPTIYRTVLTRTVTGVHVDVALGALTAVGVSDLFVTYTQPGSGSWSSLSILGGGLVAGPAVSTGSGFARHYTGDIVTATPLALRAFIQAVGGNGMVSTDTNGGSYHRVDTATATAANPKADTAILLTAPATATYRSPIAVSAVLTSGGALAGKIVSFSLGNAVVRATTAADGRAGATLPVNLLPSAAPYPVSVAFAEDDAYLTATAVSDLTVLQSTSVLVVQSSGGPVAVDYSDSAVLATLTVGAQSLPLNEEPVIVDLGAGRKLGLLTDGFGRVTISTLDFGGLAPGAYTATITYAGDARFASATTTASLTVRPENAALIVPTQASSSPVNLFKLTQQQDGALGDLTRATVAYAIVPLSGPPTSGTLGVKADGTPATALPLGPGIYLVTETVGGYFTSAAATATLSVRCGRGDDKVTGVGWVPGPGGVHQNIGLTAQLRTGDTVPQGNLEVHFAAPDASFKATAFSSLMICKDAAGPGGDEFALRGTGTVNATPGYSFAVIGADASAGDRIEIRVWSAARSESDPDYLIPLQVIQGGNITVH